MLVRSLPLILVYYNLNIDMLQINTDSEPADMNFALIESPWIRAGIQYSVRVGSLNLASGVLLRVFLFVGLVDAHQ